MRMTTTAGRILADDWSEKGKGSSINLQFVIDLIHSSSFIQTIALKIEPRLLMTTSQKRFFPTVLVLAATLTPSILRAQPYDITQFDPTSKGKWAYKGKTTLVVPKVANGSITLDGAVCAAEYGGFQGVDMTPGIGDGASAAPGTWILDYPPDRIWGGTNDSSFTFWLAHDDNYLYVGVQARDDVVNSNDPNANFWKDDAIEIVVDALNDRYDNNTDTSKDLVGGHCYVNFQGRFSGWDDTLNQKGTQMTWATGVAWTYGQTGDVFGFGKAVAGGWQME
ncbi:MAG: hypothetical protein DME26_14860, partial [Verrucomicrobia bacterium]